MLKQSTLQKFILASACLLALASAQAQVADGTVVISGQLSANTCKLRITDTAGSTNNGVRSIALETVAPPTGTIVAGTTFGTKQNITFSLTDASGTGACTFVAGTTGWNLVLDMQADQVNSVAFKAFLTNQATTNPATNVGVSLFNSSSVQFGQLVKGAGFLGTKLAGPAGVAANASLTMGAQFMTISTAAPTPGLFSATVPLLIVYN